ncbi:MAG: deoxyribose-phosphate aldolase [Alicyclobacillaceae bacterium]|nr:deoxyribose-phosphate aldolase [Alicyclobacillaceae bacterium]
MDGPLAGRVERAAGGLVVRCRGGVREVLLIEDQYGHTSFPKGHLDPGETWEDAALREVLEETGVAARILAPLGRVEYTVVRDGQPVRKQVRLFLMESIDEADEPHHQAEEVSGASFWPWPDAVRRLAAHGYANWQWVMDKADALWAWHERHLDSAWRSLPARMPLADLARAWQDALPLVERLIAAVSRELATVWPEGAGLSGLAGDPAADLPRALADEQQALQAAVEHSLLRPDAGGVDVENLCAEAVRLNLARVCVHPQHVARAAQVLAGRAGVCTVAAFPFGAAQPDALRAEVAAAVAAGAGEIDMVIPIGSMREDDVWTVARHVRAAREAAGTAVLKAIVEAHYLAVDQLLKACWVAVACGADFVKTSTGFAPTGARLMDVAVMARALSGRGRVKAAGGIRTREEAVRFLQFGAERLGTSHGAAIMRPATTVR